MLYSNRNTLIEYKRHEPIKKDDKLEEQFELFKSFLNWRDGISKKEEIVIQDYTELTFGEKIKNIREKLGYTLISFSEILGVSQRTLQRIEKNETEPTLSFLMTLKEYIGNDKFIYLLNNKS